jgi:hypothetical protein
VVNFKINQRIQLHAELWLPGQSKEKNNFKNLLLKKFKELELRYLVWNIL